MEKVPVRSIGTGAFVIGRSKVRPRLNAVFRHDEKLGIYMKVYNLTADENTRKPLGQVEYTLVKKGSGEQVFKFTEELSDLPDASASQATIEKLYDLNKLQPGQYTLQLKITDKNRNQVLTPSADFTVT
jgi:hypothetical protein